jgi:tripartite-type tricarboxylate transporter receptor subunit TctC
MQRMPPTRCEMGIADTKHVCPIKSGVSPRVWTRRSLGSTRPWAWSAQPSEHRRPFLTAALTSLAMVVLLAGFGGGAPNRTAASTSSALKKGLAFYKGQTITIIEPGATGAIFDLIARTEATYLGQYLHATVNVRDVTIGNTIPGQNDTASAPPDGLTLGLLNMGNDAGLALTHSPGVSFNPAKMQFIAANAPSATLMIASVSSPYKSFADIQHANPPAKILMENTGTVDNLIASLFGILGIRHQWLTGYTSIGTYVQGFVRGDGPIMVTNLQATGKLVAAGKARSILVNAVPPPGTLYRQYTLGIPTFASLENRYPPKTAKQKTEWAALNAFIGATSTPLVTQPGVAAYKVAALRAAAVWMFKQPGFKSQILADGQNPSYVSPAAARNDYLTTVRAGRVLAPYFASFYKGVA